MAANGGVYSFPSTQVVVSNTVCESVPLASGKERYIVKFTRQDFVLNRIARSITNSFDTQVGNADILELSDFSSVKTNAILIQRNHEPLGETRIIYEITR